MCYFDLNENDRKGEDDYFLYFYLRKKRRKNLLWTNKFPLKKKGVYKIYSVKMSWTTFSKFALARKEQKKENKPEQYGASYIFIYAQIEIYVFNIILSVQYACYKKIY